jgi:hypothetical protein
VQHHTLVTERDRETRVPVVVGRAAAIPTAGLLLLGLLELPEDLVDVDPR